MDIHVDIHDWLEKLGLGQYVEVFVANHVCVDVLKELTGDDLRELGVTSLGHRKRLLHAISLLQEDVSPTSETDRRHVAVLFADLCSFTQLARELGPERAREVVDRFFAQADEIITEHGGTVDKHMGDQAMAVFGAPVAHDNDPFRAVATADALQRAMPALSDALGFVRSRPLSIHIGIALGDVVAGEIGGRLRRDYTVVGDTVNLAARLVGEAGPGEAVFDEAVWRAVSDRVHASPLEGRQLKGVDGPQRLWRLEGLRETTTAGHLPFVGREHELAQIVASFTRSRAGTWVHLKGEAGIGKSRLLSEALAEAESRGYATVLARVIDFGAARRHGPLRVLAEAMLSRCPDLLDSSGLDVGQRAALHDVLGRAVPEDVVTPYAAMADDKRAALRADAVATLAMHVANDNPLVIAVDDMQWATATLRSFVQASARLSLLHPIVVLTTSRLEGDALDTAFSTIVLGALPPDAMHRLVAAMASTADRTAVERLVQRAAGNPLFLQQLALGASDAKPSSLPASIRGLVQARLDRLTPANRTALQAASVLGQRFSLAGMRSLIGDPAYDPRSLIHDRLLVRDADMLMFAHALIQEATYASLLDETARRYHRRAAYWLGVSEPELQAQHLDRAADPGAPAAYRLAAEQRRDSGRLARALELAERGLSFAQVDADVAALALLAGHLRLDLGAPREALAHFARALARATDDAGRGEAEFGTAASLRIVDDLVGAEAALERAQRMASRAGAQTLASRCHHLRGNLMFPRGRVAECMQQHTAALALAERAGSPALVAQALGGMADAFYAQGRMRSALEVLQRCIDTARSCGAAAVEVANRPMAAHAEWYMLRLESSREIGTLARELARQAHNQRAELIALHSLMIVAMDAGTVEEGLGHLDAAQAIVAELGAWRFEAENLILGADLHAQAGRSAVATDMARKAVRLCREHALSYIGPLTLGIAATLVDDRREREAFLREGEALLERPTVSHNHIFFRRFAIEAELAAGRSDQVRRHAKALAEYASPEPLPLTDLVVRRGLLLADAADGRSSTSQRAELGQLSETVERLGLARMAKAMRAMLPEWNVKRTGT